MPVIPERDALVGRAHLEHMLNSHPQIDPVVRHEAEVRLRLSDFLERDPQVTDIRFSDPFTYNGRYGLFDAYIHSSSTWAFVEIKERVYSSTDKTSWVIEDQKAAELEWLSNETNVPSYLASITTDDVCILSDLRSKHEVATVNCNWHTYASLGEGKRDKSLRFYPSSTAQILR